MRSYHTHAPVSRRKQGQSLHSQDAPQLQFEVLGDTLHRRIDDNARLLLQRPVVSLAIPCDILLDAERRGAHWLLLTDEHGKQYSTTLDTFWKPPSFAVDRGYGRQRALPLAAMTNPSEAQQQCLFEVTFA